MMPMESAAKEEDARSILLIESNKKDAGLIQDYLEGLKCKMNWVRDWKEAIYQLNQEKKDLMILSLPLPGSDGLKFCKRLKGLESTKSMQIMVLSGRKDPAISVRTEDYGVDDFMLKPVKKEVFKARINLLLQMNDGSENQVDSLQTSAWETITDQQSGLYERSYFMRQLEIEIKRSLRQKYSLTLIMIHIRLSEMGDDKFGDLTLDQIMKRYGKLVKDCIRDEDLATYYRDKEFAIAMPFLDRNNALSTTKRIQEAIVIHDLLPRESADSSTLKVNSGIAFCPDDASTAEELIEKANAALGKAEKEGDGEICEWEERSTTE
jgi:two-component system cell cycle response regulator